MPNGLRIENDPYKDKPPTYFENVVIDIRCGSGRPSNAFAELLDADSNEVVAVMSRPRLRINAQGLFLIGSNGDWKGEDGAEAIRYAWKIPLSIFQNLPDGVEVREATDEEQKAALDEALPDFMQRRVTPAEMAAAPSVYWMIRLTYGQPERPLASYNVGLEKGDRIVSCFTDSAGWLQIASARLNGLVAIHYGGTRRKIQWPSEAGERITINVGKDRPKDLMWDRANERASFRKENE